MLVRGDSIRGRIRTGRIRKGEEGQVDLLRLQLINLQLISGNYSYNLQTASFLVSCAICSIKLLFPPECKTFRLGYGLLFPIRCMYQILCKLKSNCFHVWTDRLINQYIMLAISLHRL